MAIEEEEQYHADAPPQRRLIIGAELDICEASARLQGMAGMHRTVLLWHKLDTMHLSKRLEPLTDLTTGYCAGQSADI